jgi:PAS domain S-box-containing protein
MDLHPGPKQCQVYKVRTMLDPIRRALQENDDWYQDLVEHSHDLLCIHDLAGQLLAVNPAPARVLGYSVEELLKIPMRELVPPHARAEFDAYLAEIERTGEARGFLQVMTRSGERRIWEYHNTLRTEGVDSPIVRGIAHDVTEQKRKEKLLRETGERLFSEARENERIIQDLELFRSLVDNCNDAVEVVDPKTLRFLDVNQKACRSLGYSREELLSLTVLDIDPKVTAASVAKIAEKLRNAGSLVVESEHRRKDGSVFPVEVSMKWVSLDRKYVVTIAHDLTARKQAEARLQASEIRYHALHDRAPVGICRVETISHRFLEVNPTFCEIVGRTEQDMLERNVESITHPDDLGKSLGKLRQLAAGELRHYSIEKRYIRPDGSVRWVEAEIVAMWPDEAKPTWHMAVVQDITERRLAEEALRTSERRQHKITKQLEAERARLIEAQAVAKVGSWEAELPSLEIIWSEQTHRIFETDPSHFHPRRPDFVKFIHPEDRAKVDAAFQASLDKGGPSNIEYRIVVADGRLKVLEEQWTVFHDEQGLPIRLMGTCRDITERKRAEDALRERERTQKLILDHLPVGVILSSVGEEKALCHNPKFLELFGYSAEEISTVADWWTLAYPDPAYREWVSQEWSRRMAQTVKTDGGEIEPMEVTITCRDGRKKYVRVLAQMIGDRNFITFIDLSERKQAEEALKKSEEKFSKAFRLSPVAITITTMQNPHYVEVNEAFERMTGWRRDEVIGRTPLETRIWVNFSEREELTRRLLADGYVRDVEASIRRKDGEIRVGLGTAELIELHGEACAITAFADVTERTQAKEALRRSEENYRMFVSQSSEGIFRQDMDTPVSISLPEDELVHHILYDSYMAECNDAQAAMYGLKSGKEFVGKRLTEMLPPDDPHNIALARDYVRSGFRILDRESHEVDIHGNPKVFVNSMIGTVEDGKLVRTWGIQRDITEKVKLEEFRRKAEEALQQNVAQLQAVTEELRLAKEKLSEEKLYLEQTIDAELGFGEIIGRSPALHEVMGKVGKVAPSDATVLLLGETGTGKELVARAVHRMSKRQQNSFVKMNCAAIPSGLLESELFGHEKGAFTGAVAKKLGRLELADRGTLFLDEIGEIPLELQPKLLRVLQDQEFERLGGTQTLKVDFRLIAATNRDLHNSVNRKEFRSDLYYRLNVFPLRIPALRERREDIALLVEHFVRKYASRMSKSILSIPAKTMETLMQWSWPGNIRELENFVERSVILTPGKVLQAPLGELHPGTAPASELAPGAAHDKERDRILRALHDCKGRLGGPDGAAARLGLKRTTLQSKLVHFGIKSGGYRA